MTLPIEPCDVWELARGRGQVQGELPLAAATRLVDELYGAEGALRYRLTGLIDARGRAAATLELDGLLRMRCDRCGGPVDVPIRERQQFFFVSDEAELARLPIDDAPDEPLLGSRRFDVAALVEEQVILALPISPRHAACTAPSVPADGAAAAGDTHRPFEALAALRPSKR